MRGLTTVLAMLGTVGAHHAARRLHARFRTPLLNVVLVGAGLIMATLLLLKVPYADYVPARRLMTSLLGPATVGLAVPLHRHWDLVRRHAWSILAGVGLGALTALLTVAWLSAFMGLPRDLVLSLLPRSITIPFAVEVVKLHGGNPALASAFVVATGTLGSVLGGSLLTWFRVRSALARGLAMGVGAHGQGTAMAFLEGQTEGTLAGLAMTLGGVTTTLLVPWVIRFVLKG